MKKNGGFTILELIVVMAILAILILIAIPNFNEYVAEAKEVAELGDARSLYTGAVGSIISETSKGPVSVDWTQDTFKDLQSAISESTTIQEPIMLKTYINFSSVEYFRDHNPDKWIVCYGKLNNGSVIDPGADIYIIAPSGSIYKNGMVKVG